MVDQTNKLVVCIALFALAAAVSGAARAATIKGRVMDAAGGPAQGATVLVYSAGVRKGYSTFCPTCYVDCGKRAITDVNGEYAIAGVDDELVFNLIALHDGRIPAWIRGVDPLKGVPVETVLKPRVESGETQMAGRIVDKTGSPVPYAVVQLTAVLARNGGGTLGTFPDGFAVSNTRGEFLLAANDPGVAENLARTLGGPISGMLMEVKPRGLAPKLYTARLDGRKQEITVSEGATVRGRLLFRGNPVPGAQLALATMNRMNGAAYSSIHIGTDEEGRFAITNVPVGRVWSLEVSGDSLAEPAIAEPRYLSTERDGQVVNVGDMVMQIGYSLGGRVILADGKPLPADMRISASNKSSSRSVILPPDGRFEIKGLKGPYMLIPQVRGYRLPDDVYLETVVQRDTRDLTITLEPLNRSPVSEAEPKIP